MRFGRAVVAIAFSFGIVAASAAPAAAHGIGGVEPTNVRSRVLSVQPAVAGVTVKVIENGNRVELRNQRGAGIVVFGYEGEPYLRTGPDGTFENARSPATFLNRTLDPPAEVPGSYDAGAEPEWRRVGDGDVVRWHDHRAHPMGSGAFATSHWTIDLTVDGTAVAVRGDVAWIEPGPWWPWLLLAAAIALVVAVAARYAWRLTVTCVLAILLWAEVLHVVGSWSLVASTLGGRIGAQAMSAAAIAVGGYALFRAYRDDPAKSAPFVLIAAVVFVVAGGISDVSSLWHSQLPSSLPADAVRALVALAFGGGVGLGVASRTHLAAREHELASQTDR